MNTAVMESAEHAKQYGFWTYLMSDAIIFALLFATYGTMTGNLAGGPGGGDLFELGNSLYETVFLLLSTLTCGLAMTALQTNAKNAVIPWLLVTLCFGIGFIAMEVSEFNDLVSIGAGPSRSGFLSAFFTLVGTHGLHVTVGILWLLVMIGQIIDKGLTHPVVSRLYRFSLFWHFLDLIWIAIFSVVYLPGVLA